MYEINENKQKAGLQIFYFIFASVKMRITTPSLLAILTCTAAAVGLGTAQATTVIWDFNLPSTGDPSVDPPYPSVATLTLTDSPSLGDYVEFTLDPNEANPGYGLNSTVDALNIAYTGIDLSSTAYEWISGPVANADSFQNQEGVRGPYVAVVPSPDSAANMDAGYTSQDGQLKLTWNNPDFPVADVSVWRILGTSIADNFSVMASANNKPSPTFGVFSVSQISQFEGGPVPNPSNWVTGPAPVPVPAAAWLFGSGLLGLASFARRRRK